MSDTSSSSYPRTYTVAGAWKAMLVFAGLVFIVPAGAILLKYFTGSLHDNAAAAVSLLLLAIGLGILGNAFLSKVVLYPDAIEIYGLLPMRRLARDDIKGRKSPSGRAMTRGNSMWLVPKDTSARKSTVSAMVNPDDVLWHWLMALPDLDRAEREEGVREMLQDSSAGTTVEERVATLAAAKKLAKTANIAAGVFCFAAYVLPLDGLLAATVATFPWIAIAIAARAPHFYTLNDSRNDPRAGLGIVFLAPGFVLMMACFMEVHVVSLGSIHAGAFALVAVLGFLATRVDGKLVRNKMILVLLPLLLPYGYGTLILANALPDTSSPKVYHARVISKRYTSGRGSHPELTISPWGPDSGGSIAVSRDIYKAVSPNDDVCANLRNGVFGVPWYTIRLCH